MRRMFANPGLRGSLLLGSLLLVGCAAGGDNRRLYDELGGQVGIEAIVEGLLFKLVDDPASATISPTPTFCDCAKS